MRSSRPGGKAVAWPNCASTAKAKGNMSDYYLSREEPARSLKPVSMVLTKAGAGWEIAAFHNTLEPPPGRAPVTFRTSRSGRKRKASNSLTCRSELAAGPHRPASAFPMAPTGNQLQDLQQTFGFQ